MKKNIVHFNDVLDNKIMTKKPSQKNQNNQSGITFFETILRNNASTLFKLLTPISMPSVVTMYDSS